MPLVWQLKPWSRFFDFCSMCCVSPSSSFLLNPLLLRLLPHPSTATLFSVYLWPLGHLSCIISWLPDCSLFISLSLSLPPLLLFGLVQIADSSFLYGLGLASWKHLKNLLLFLYPSHHSTQLSRKSTLLLKPPSSSLLLREIDRATLQNPLHLYLQVKHTRNHSDSSFPLCSSLSLKPLGWEESAKVRGLGGKREGERE